MDAETLIALESSIEHWERMRDDPWRSEAPTADYCALCCSFYFDRLKSYRCEGCPVFIKTGKTLCQNTPYKNASMAFYKIRGMMISVEDQQAALDDWQTKATEEIEFLKSLRPNEKTNEQKENQ